MNENVNNRKSEHINRTTITGQKCARTQTTNNKTVKFIKSFCIRTNEWNEEQRGKIYSTLYYGVDKIELNQLGVSLALIKEEGMIEIYFALNGTFFFAAYALPPCTGFHHKQNYSNWIKRCQVMWCRTKIKVNEIERAVGECILMAKIWYWNDSSLWHPYDHIISWMYKWISRDESYFNKL